MYLDWKPGQNQEEPANSTQKGLGITPTTLQLYGEATTAPANSKVNKNPCVSQCFVKTLHVH